MVDNGAGGLQLSLDEQAHQMAESALSALSSEAKKEKFAAVKEGILKRLKAQAGSQPLPPNPTVSFKPPPPPLEPLVLNTQSLIKVGSAEACGDEPWFADSSLRQSLIDATRAAHSEQKILVGPPADEIDRICPGEFVLGAGAVLRLGGAHHGGYGESDVKYAYRQLSRALHPDKNPGVAKAPDAFKRLSEAVDELQTLLNDTRKALQSICNVVGSTTSPEMLERPQSPLIAEASRLLSAVVGLTGEGEPMDSQRGLRRRAVTAFTMSPVWSGCDREKLLSKWYDEDQLLDLFAGSPMRNAYDCMQKRYRAQFLSLIYRAAAVEAVRNDGCVRGSWPAVMAQFPEVTLWQNLMGRLLHRVYVSNDADDDQAQALGDDNDRPSAWAQGWRDLIVDVLPSGRNAAASATDRELRYLAASLWDDIVKWIRQEEDSGQYLQLFVADNGGSDWAFIPAMDVLLTVADGMTTITAEGISTDSPPDHERLTFDAAMRKSRRQGKKRGLQLPSESQPAVKKAKLSRSPTRIVLLTNMVGAGDIDDDLQDETAEEAAKYGKLIKCTIKEAVGAPDNEAVRIFLEFEKVEAASKAYADMNGRFFDGRTVKARFYDEDRYRRGDLERKGPTRTILLTNIVDRSDVDEDLQWETAEEAGKFGRVTRCTIVQVPEVSESEAVQAFLDFESVDEATKAFLALNGRSFGGREIKARYVEEGSTSFEESGTGKADSLSASADDSKQRNVSPQESTPANKMDTAVDATPGSAKQSESLDAAKSKAVCDEIPKITSATTGKDNKTGLWLL
eukprot:TRINITY_DN15490_c0_g1_i1.p1 TRINITY_DN15490_c0_g1~~TRINITY_DN15490_c0_g1_i1.p1  ORF type:complete len:792 (+),score=111.77 TRINITY_DN15490_c0_g1_i1:92-2467(+)